MKTALCLLWILGTGCLFSAPSDEPSPTKIISDAQEALQKLEIINAKLNEIFKKRANGSTLETESTGIKKEQEMELYHARSACLESTLKCANMLKSGASVFSYPGLIALSRVDFDQAKNTYKLRLVIGYGSYENGDPRYPTYRVVEFDHHGLIINLEDFATARMVSK